MVLRRLGDVKLALVRWLDPPRRESAKESWGNLSAVITFAQLRANTKPTARAATRSPSLATPDCIHFLLDAHSGQSRSSWRPPLVTSDVRANIWAPVLRRRLSDHFGLAWSWDATAMGVGGGLRRWWKQLLRYLGMIDLAISWECTTTLATENGSARSRLHPVSFVCWPRVVTSQTVAGAG